MSCRRGVKDGDCGCCKSLAAKVRELYQRCANAIKSINGINPDGANNFDILAGAGIQVNPRANGIEIVNTGALPPATDSIETINQIAPDADHDFAITAGAGIQINAGTNGIEIENTSQGAIYTATAPIQIDADNDISLKDWTIHGIDYTDLFDATKTLKDMLIIINTTSNHRISFFIPKNTALTTNKLTLQFCEQYVGSPTISNVDIHSNLATSNLQPSRLRVRVKNNTTYYTIEDGFSFTGNAMYKKDVYGTTPDSIFLFTRD